MDTSRYVENDIVFTQSDNLAHRFVVSLTSIQVNGIYLNGQRGNAELLDSSWRRAGQEQQISIDSTLPYIYLPNETCTVFEQALNLTWDEPTQLYILSDSQHEDLLELNPSFTFTIAENATSEETLKIDVPYKAFSLEATGPEILGAEGKTWYFPLRRLPEDGTQRLGRAFMQSIYLYAEFHKKTFRVFQANLDGGASNIKSLAPMEDVPISKSGGGGGSSGGSKAPIGAIVGGVVGGIAVIAAIIGFLLWRRRKQAKTPKTSEPPAYDPSTDPKYGYVPEIDGATKMPNELSGNANNAWGQQPVASGIAYPNPESKHVVEVQGVHEMHGQSMPQQWSEADSTPVNAAQPKTFSPSDYQRNQDSISPLIAHELPTPSTPGSLAR